jgi:hypothetical protein
MLMKAVDELYRSCNSSFAVSVTTTKFTFLSDHLGEVVSIRFQFFLSSKLLRGFRLNFAFEGDLS